MSEGKEGAPVVRFLLGCWDLRSRCVQELRGMVQSAGPFLFFPFSFVLALSATSNGRRDSAFFVHFRVEGRVKGNSPCTHTQIRRKTGPPISVRPSLVHTKNKLSSLHHHPVPRSFHPPTNTSPLHPSPPHSFQSNLSRPNSRHPLLKSNQQLLPTLE